MVGLTRYPPATGGYEGIMLGLQGTVSSPPSHSISVCKGSAPSGGGEGWQAPLGTYSMTPMALCGGQTGFRQEVEGIPGGGRPGQLRGPGEQGLEANQGLEAKHQEDQWPEGPGALAHPQCGQPRLLPRLAESRHLWGPGWRAMGDRHTQRAQKPPSPQAALPAPDHCAER